MIHSGKPVQLRSHQRFCTGGEVTHFDDLFVDVGQEEVDIGSDLGLFTHDGSIRVDEERASQRVRVVVHVGSDGLNAFDGEHLEGVLILGVVSVAEEPDRIGTAQDTLNKHVVILGEVELGSVQDRLFVLIEDLFDEIVEGSRVGARDVAHDGLSRPIGVDICPGLSSRKDSGKFVDCYILDKVVLLANSDCQSIGADAELDGCAAEGGAGFNFAVFNGAGSVGDIGLTGLAEALEAATRADGVDGDLTSETFVLEAGGHNFSQREDGGTASSDHIARYGQRVNHRHNPVNTFHDGSFFHYLFNYFCFRISDFFYLFGIGLRRGDRFCLRFGDIFLSTTSGEQDGYQNK